MVQEARKLTDDYEVKGILGRGGFSVVREGVQQSGEGNISVAIKTLRRFGQWMPPSTPRKNRGLETSSQASKRALISDALLTNELLVMRKIVEDVSPHPNVIHLYDVCEDSDGVHLILEHCSGGELFDKIVSQDRYSEVAAANVIRQISQGLKALHKASIVHRDLKPENCLFLNKQESSPLKIMDFGLSSVVEDDFSHPVVGLFGSVDYVSPEALSRQKITTKTDIWSLGVILYILLSGYPPFFAPSNQQKQQMIMSGHFSFYEATWKNISSSAKQLISDLLKVNPEMRPSAEQILEHPWVVGDSAKEDPMDAEIVSRLQSFNARRKFRAAALASVLSSSFSLRSKKLKNLMGSYDLKPEELTNLSVTFKKMQVVTITSNILCFSTAYNLCNFSLILNGENATLSEFEEVLKAMEMSALVPLAPRIFDLFDNNRDGTVDMREIIAGFSSLKYSQGDDALRLCFQALPDDCLAVDITEPGKLDEVFDLMDANNDGKVTFEEFKAAMQRDSSLQDVVLSSLRPNY
ncbi:hypothetical protein Leryth_017364 [Lithospermum erythrorhizon]|nr:hypothetical protein Leryth_017364 [Lithospermum erythrorhizon]